MKFKFDIKTITGLGILLAVEIVLQVVGNFVTIGTISLNLSLIPIVLAAILYGPIGGLILGLFNGVLVLPSSFAVFLMGYNPFLTILMCLLKTGLAGFIAGLIYLPFKNKSNKLSLVGVILASIATPLINTLIFGGGMLLCFNDYVFEAATNEGLNPVVFVLVGLIGVNFFFELGVNTVLAPTIYKVVDIIKKRASQ